MQSLRTLLIEIARSPLCDLETRVKARVMLCRLNGVSVWDLVMWRKGQLQ